MLPCSHLYILHPVTSHEYVIAKHNNGSTRQEGAPSFAGVVQGDSTGRLELR